MQGRVVCFFVVVVLALSLLCEGAARLDAQECENQFLQFAKKYNKDYSSNEERSVRQQIYCANWEKIESHNELFREGKVKYSQKINEFGDMTVDEFKSRFGFNKPAFDDSVSAKTPAATKHNTAALPDSWDWAAKGVVGPVPNQGQCGSNWAFSAVDAIASCHAITTGQYVPLSVQQVVDCSGSFGNQGCDGGWMSSVYQYVISNGGIDGADSYPYVSVDSSCNYSVADCASILKSYANVTSGDEAALQQAVYTTPVSAAIDGSNLMYYEGGIYDGPCSSTNVDMGILITGWGVQNGNEYWILQISWGTAFGMNGYVWLARNQNNMCGIATVASYPIGCPNCPQH